MPIEAEWLRELPESLEACPQCGAVPFGSLLRGVVQRPESRWWGLVKEPRYCASICASCQEIVGYEDPRDPELRLRRILEGPRKEFDGAE